MRLILAIWLCLSAVAAPPLFRAQNVAVDTAFSPDDLPDLALWLDADDASTLTLSGSVVDEWRDKSGNGRHFTGSGSARPALVSAAYNGRDAIQFDGVNDVLLLGSNALIRNQSGATVYLAMRWRSVPTTGGPVFWVSKPDSATRLSLSGGSWAGGTSGKVRFAGRRDDGDGFSGTPSSANTPTTWGTITGIYDYANAKRYQYIGTTLDGLQDPFQTAGSVSDTVSAGASIGSAGGIFADVEITEILVYHAAHDDSTRAQVESYLTR